LTTGFSKKGIIELKVAPYLVPWKLSVHVYSVKTHQSQAPLLSGWSGPVMTFGDGFILLTPVIHVTLIWTHSSWIAILKKKNQEMAYY